MVALHQKRSQSVGTIVGAFERGVVLVVGHPGVVVHLVVFAEKHRDGAGFLNLGLLLFTDFVFRGHASLHRLRFVHRRSKHEEGDQKHDHVHHRRKVDAGAHLFGAWLLTLPSVFLFYFSHMSISFKELTQAHRF